MTLPKVSVWAGLVMRIKALKLLVVLLAIAKFIAPNSVATIAITKKYPNLLTLFSKKFHNCSRYPCLKWHQDLESNVMGISVY